MPGARKAATEGRRTLPTNASGATRLGNLVRRYIPTKITVAPRQPCARRYAYRIFATAGQSCAEGSAFPKAKPGFYAEVCEGMQLTTQYIVPSRRPWTARYAVSLPRGVSHRDGWCENLQVTKGVPFTTQCFPFPHACLGGCGPDVLKALPNHVAGVCG